MERPAPISRSIAIHLRCVSASFIFAKNITCFLILCVLQLSDIIACPELTIGFPHHRFLPPLAQMESTAGLTIKHLVFQLHLMIAIIWDIIRLLWIILGW